MKWGSSVERPTEAAAWRDGRRHLVSRGADVTKTLPFSGKRVPLVSPASGDRIRTARTIRTADSDLSVVLVQGLRGTISKVDRDDDIFAFSQRWQVTARHRGEYFPLVLAALRSLGSAVLITIPEALASRPSAVLMVRTAGTFRFPGQAPLARARGVHLDCLPFVSLGGPSCACRGGICQPRTIRR